MTNLSKLEFHALELNGSNYLTWVIDAEIQLDANKLGETIKEENKASTQSKAEAIFLLRHHLSEDLKTEYLIVKDSSVIWKSLKDQDHLKTLILSQVNYDWLYMCLQDTKFVSEYNSTMFRITSQLKLCSEKVKECDMFEKNFTTVHASNMLLQQQYRERKFTKYSKLISCLLVAKKNNELLMKNHQARPTGVVAVLEVNDVDNHKHNRDGRGRNNEPDQGHGRGRRQYLKPKNTQQKNERNNDKPIMQNMLVTDMEARVIGVVPVVPQNIELSYKKSRLKSDVHLADKLDPGREAIHAEDTTQLDINEFYVDSQKK